MQSQGYASQPPPGVLTAHKVLGALQIGLGGLVIILNLASLAVGLGVVTLIHGYWSGPFFIIAGIFGVLAGVNGSRGQAWAIASLVLSIIACVVGLIALIVGAIASAGLSSSGGDAAGIVRGFFIINIICVLLFAIEFVVAIVQSAFACRVSCCAGQAAPIGFPGRQPVNEAA